MPPETSGSRLACVFPRRWAICSTIASTGVSGVPAKTVLVTVCEAFMSGFTFRARTFGLHKPGEVSAAIEWRTCKGAKRYRWQTSGTPDLPPWPGAVRGPYSRLVPPGRPSPGDGCPCDDCRGLAGQGTRTVWFHLELVGGVLQAVP